MSKHCVVLGANGFIGSHVCEALLHAGHRVVAFDICHEFTALSPHPQLRCVTGDFLDRETVRQTVAGADWVFHLVCTTLPASSNANMVFDVQTNVVASIELLQICVEQGVQRLIFASSGGTVYGVHQQQPIREDSALAPIVSYGITKLTIERYCYLYAVQHNLPVSVLRIANPYGPRHHGSSQGAVSVFLKQLRAGQPIHIWGDGQVVRDYIYIQDVTTALCRAAEHPAPYLLCNVGTGVGTSLRQLVELIHRITGVDYQVIYEPARGFDVPKVVLDIQRAREQLAWVPQFTLEQGILATWQSMD